MWPKTHFNIWNVEGSIAKTAQQNVGKLVLIVRCKSLISTQIREVSSQEVCSKMMCVTRMELDEQCHLYTHRTCPPTYIKGLHKEWLDFGITPTGHITSLLIGRGIIGELPVKCTHVYNGCQWKGTIATLEKHLATCDYFRST